MKTSASIFSSTIALLLAMLVLVSSADAQKKKKDQAAPPAQQQATEQTPAPQPAAKGSSPFRDYLMQYQGMPTNLGKLVKVAGDYFILEDDGVQSAHRIDVIHTIKLLKAEEGEPAKLELKLLARD
jgi:hypothetical protein